MNYQAKHDILDMFRAEREYPHASRKHESRKGEKS
jgi:hypothetical protein